MGSVQGSQDSKLGTTFSLEDFILAWEFESCVPLVHVPLTPFKV